MKGITNSNGSMADPTLAGMTIVKSDSAPTNTSVLWLDTLTYPGYAVLKFYNGTAWVAVNSLYGS